MSFKSGFISIVGRPNVGKSSLLNEMVGSKISIVTNKAQTTRHNVHGILTLPNKYQFIFIDTPGLHQTKKILDQKMNSSVFKGIKDSDLILFVAPANEKIGKSDMYLLQDISKKQIPFLVVLSKKDLVNDRQLEDKIKEWQKIIGEKKMLLPISIYDENTLNKLIKKILELLPENSYQYFNENVLTDQPEKIRFQDFIREAILFKTGQEIPHNTLVIVNSFAVEKQNVNIEATVIVERESQKGIIIGLQGKKIKDIKYLARKQLKKLYPEKKINLDLKVKVKKNWRNSPSLIKKETSNGNSS